MRTTRIASLALIGLLLVAVTASAAVKMPALFGDGMVLQQQKPVPVWGWADAKQEVTVKFAGQEKKATADDKGKWIVKLDALKVNTKPAVMTITAGDETVEIKNVLVGEVWLCSGQSNMEWTVGGCNAPDDIAAAKYPLIRTIKVPHTPSAEYLDDFQGSWTACDPSTVARFTAVGYFFARKIHKELGVPVGLVNSSWGGTRIEPWVHRCGFAAVPELRELADKTFEAKNHQEPTVLQKGMIAPLVPMAIRGALWYQGESNGSEGVSYYHKKQALIGGWRRIFQQGDFPFYFVQLANFQQPNTDPKGGDGWARLREAQLHTLQIPNTGMAVITDIGDARDIHPKNKQDVGLRLALWALAKDYDKKDLVYSGPLYKSMKVEGDKIRIALDCVGGGLIVGKKEGRKPVEEVKDGELTWFSIADADQNWHHAKAVIDGDTVVVSCDEVKTPAAVRYAFTINPEGSNLYNKEGLPASPFRTDSW
ncbi:MAG: sialate O-acetylesterase [Candidatus Nealsonbacteria bacterium]|nr:sialate O-acetylesterase [Candidatus Nealsonbacteria bacterium]